MADHIIAALRAAACVSVVLWQKGLMTKQPVYTVTLSAESFAMVQVALRTYCDQPTTNQSEVVAKRYIENLLVSWGNVLPFSPSPNAEPGDAAI